MNLIPKSHLLIQGASGFGGATFFKSNSYCRTLSSTLGIMFGGLTKGKEKEGLEKKLWIVFVFDSEDNYEGMENFNSGN